MPTLTIDGQPFEIPAGKRLVNAITDDAGQDQLHACGGKAACTTCRVQFDNGEPTQMTQAEKDILAAKNLSQIPGLRLSCQISCDADMSINLISRFAGSGRKDAGGRPADSIAPPPVWTSR